MKRLKVGIVGLGKAFMLMAPTLHFDDRIQVVAGCDFDERARRQFLYDFPGSSAYSKYEEMCFQPDIDLIYVATPHQYHAEHALFALERGKHVLVEKPIALKLEDCDRLINAAQAHNLILMEGHSHSMDAPIAKARELIESGNFGRPRMLHMMNYTDFLYRPRRPEELQTDKGGGVLFNQAPHQISVARRLATGNVVETRAVLGDWDCARNTEGAYTLQLIFDSGMFASLTYSGYAHFDTDVLMGGISEIGRKKTMAGYGLARKRLMEGNSETSEVELKRQGGYGWGESLKTLLPENAVNYHHFGHVIISCEKADILPTPSGVDIYSDFMAEKIALPNVAVPRKEVIDELYASIFLGHKPFHDGVWARETLRICLSMTKSNRIIS